MVNSSAELLNNLIETSGKHIAAAERFLQLSEEELNFRPGEKSWSVLECIEHLNRYFTFYNPEFRKRINLAEKKSQENFKPGLLGDYFAKSMLPKGKLNKMKTFSSMNPLHSKLDKSVIEKFISELKILKDILEDCRYISLNKVKSGVSISKFIKLKMGDALRVIIYHNERHILQAKNALKAFNHKEPVKAY